MSHHYSSLDKYQTKLKNILSSRSKSINDRFVKDRQKSNNKLSSASKSSSSYQSRLSQMFQEGNLRQWVIRKRYKQPQITKKISRKILPLLQLKIHSWEDQFYSNLLDWSCYNLLAAAVSRKLTIFHMKMCKEMIQYKPTVLHVGGYGQEINAIKFSPFEKKIILGYSVGSLINLDLNRPSNQQNINVLNVRCSRINYIDWFEHSIYIGFKDSSLCMLDDRHSRINLVIDSIDNSQICGVKSTENYIAIGTNNGRVNIYDKRKTIECYQSYNHDAAVKALAWRSPHKLISGGGQADGLIKFWSSKQGLSESFINTGSQICTLLYSKNTDEILSTHGFSVNSLMVWNKKKKIQMSIHAHTNRVLWSALSPCGDMAASGSVDKSLKVWSLFKVTQQNKQLVQYD